MLLAVLFRQAVLRLWPLHRHWPNWPAPLSEAELDLPPTVRLEFEQDNDEAMTRSWRELRDRQAYRAAWQRRLVERSQRRDRSILREEYCRSTGN